MTDRVEVTDENGNKQISVVGNLDGKYDPIEEMIILTGKGVELNFPFGQFEALYLDMKRIRREHEGR